MSKPASVARLDNQPATKRDIDSLETSVNRLEIKVGDLETEVSDFKKEVNGRLDGLSEEVGEVHRLLEVLNSKL